MAAAASAGISAINYGITGFPYYSEPTTGDIYVRLVPKWVYPKGSDPKEGSFAGWIFPERRILPKATEPTEAEMRESILDYLSNSACLTAASKDKDAELSIQAYLRQHDECRAADAGRKWIVTHVAIKISDPSSTARGVGGIGSYAYGVDEEKQPLWLRLFEGTQAPLEALKALSSQYNKDKKILFSDPYILFAGSDGIYKACKLSAVTSLAGPIQLDRPYARALIDFLCAYYCLSLPKELTREALYALAETDLGGMEFKESNGRTVEIFTSPVTLKPQPSLTFASAGAAVASGIAGASASSDSTFR
jgi:hypothetical protein